MPLATLSPLLLRRAAYGALALSLLAAAFVVAGPWWALAAGLVGPDLALLAGAAGGSPPGRSIRAACASTTPSTGSGSRPCSASSAALDRARPAWAAHVAVDRAVGYGLRDARGFQRGA